MNPVNVWIVEDDSVYRRSLERRLGRQEQITCSQAFPSCIEFLEALETEMYPDLVLMDLGLPEMSGIEGIRKLLEKAPDIPVLVLTTFQDKQKVLDALDAGADGYLLKTATGQEIIKGIQDVFKGQSILSPMVAKLALEEIRKPVPEDTFKLTEREIEVLEELAKDLTSKEIAANLDITPRTVTNHLTNIYTKMNVPSSTGAVAKALRAGII